LKILNTFQTSPLGRASKLLTRRDFRIIAGISFFQMALGLLDLAGVAAIGVLGALAVTGVSGQNPGNRVSSVLDLFHISGLSFQSQVALLGAAAGVLMFSRTLLSIALTRKTLFYLSKRGAEITADLVERLLSQSLLTIQQRTLQETLFAVTRGVEAIMIQVFGSIVGLIADVSLLIILGVGLFFVDSNVAIGTCALFALIGIGLHRFMRKKALMLGVKNSELEVKSNEKIVEVFHSFREVVVKNRRSYYSSEIGQMRLNVSKIVAERAYLPHISRYVIDSTVVVGSLFLGAMQFVMQDARHAVGTLAVFLAAGARIAPAVLRTQQGLVQFRGGIGQSNLTLSLIDSMDTNSVKYPQADSFDLVHLGFVSDVKITNLSFSYPENEQMVLNNISLHLPSNTVSALVGPSGAGKTTLADIILGILEPDSGSITISGESPLEAISIWNGAMAYVPQDVVIINGTIRENVALGYPASRATDEQVLSALRTAQLVELVASMPLGLDTPVGDRGTKLSGGQRQRLGIARAMFTQPKLLVLDEATSSLDGQTEADISDAIQALKGSVMVIMIAHRLSTVRKADLVVYLEKGKVLARGTFEEVRSAVPDFDNQARLMGL
jgi:ABC-type multidrug transport system fused ATPase/permease subunit